MAKPNIAQIINRFLHKLKDASVNEGFFYIFHRIINHYVKKRLKKLFYYYYYKLVKSSNSFNFQGKDYKYFFHKYNNTWENERIVEIPIFWGIMQSNEGKSILEVGNVLSHYFNVDHDIVDKYERAKGIINQDIVDFNNKKKYDLIISISTIEHIGWTEKPFDPKKVIRVIEILKNHLTSNGKIIVSIPIGYNPNLDKILHRKEIAFQEFYALKRISGDNRWIETNWKNIQHAKSGIPYPHANGLVIGIIQK